MNVCVVFNAVFDIILCTMRPVHLFMSPRIIHRVSRFSKEFSNVFFLLIFRTRWRYNTSNSGSQHSVYSDFIDVFTKTLKPTVSSGLYILLKCPIIGLTATKSLNFRSKEYQKDRCFLFQAKIG